MAAQRVTTRPQGFNVSFTSSVCLSCRAWLRARACLLASQGSTPERDAGRARSARPRPFLSPCRSLGATRGPREVGGRRGAPPRRPPGNPRSAPLPISSEPRGIFSPSRPSSDTEVTEQASDGAPEGSGPGPSAVATRKKRGRDRGNRCRRQSFFLLFAFRVGRLKEGGRICPGEIAPCLDVPPEAHPRLQVKKENRRKSRGPTRPSSAGVGAVGGREVRTLAARSRRFSLFPLPARFLPGRPSSRGGPPPDPLPTPRTSKTPTLSETVRTDPVDGEGGRTGDGGRGTAGASRTPLRSVGEIAGSVANAPGPERDAGVFGRRLPPSGGPEHPTCRRQKGRTEVCPSLPFPAALPFPALPWPALPAPLLLRTPG